MHFILHNALLTDETHNLLYPYHFLSSEEDGSRSREPSGHEGSRSWGVGLHQAVRHAARSVRARYVRTNEEQCV